MAREFDQLQSRRRAQLADTGYLHDLQDQVSSRGTPPPSLNAPMMRPVDPSVDTFRQRFAPFSSDPIGDMIQQRLREPNPTTIEPGTQERFGDPTKVISGRPLRLAQAGEPKGLRFVDEAPTEQSTTDLPKGLRFVDESAEGKVGRFLENVTPEGPISGVISLMRTAGQAAQGRRPDLLAAPEAAIPEAVQGMIAGTGARAVGRLPIEPGAARSVPYAAERYPSPYVPPQEPLQLTSRLSPEEAFAIERGQRLSGARMEAKQVAQRLRETGQMPPESTGPTIDLPGPITPPPPPSPLLPPQLVREFGAVRKGVELKERMNPLSEQNVSAREQALQAAIRPHLNSIEAVGRRTSAPIAALEAAIPSLSDAVSTPGKAASVANWVRVYERAARANFTPQAKASLNLATKNLNNNLGTELTLGDVLKE